MKSIKDATSGKDIVKKQKVTQKNVIFQERNRCWSFGGIKTKINLISEHFLNLILWSWVETRKGRM